MDGRNEKGKFAKGWKGGPGNPHVARLSGYRAKWLSLLNDDDIERGYLQLMSAVDAGEPWAIKELFDRTLGKAQGNDNVNITTDADTSNPFIDYLHRKPELAREVSAFYRRMASDTGDDGAPHQQGQVDVAGSPGPVVEQASRSGDDPG